jgi:hypothetical protein
VNTIAPDDDALRRLEDETRQAWTQYYQELHDLTGAEYERVELECWDTLQGELERIDLRRRRAV